MAAKDLTVPSQITKPELRLVPHYAESDVIYASDGASDAGGRTVPLFNVYPGVKIVRAGVTVTAVANPTGTTIDIGDSDDTDRLLPTANVTETTAGSYERNPNFLYASSDPVVINALVTSTGDATDDALTFRAYIEYLPWGDHLS